MSRQYKLFGSIEITDNDRPSPAGNSAKGCALIAYLIVTNQTQSREHIADLLWEATTTIQSLKNLRSLLPRIRKWIPELVIGRKTLAFQPRPETFVDLYQLEVGLESVDCSQLDQALRLYSGDLLAGFYLPDAPRFNEWLIMARERWRLRVLDGYRRLCGAYAEENLWEMGVQAGRRWLALDELDEAALRQLLRLLAAAGRTEAALEQYEHSRQRLWAELGVEPEPSTIEIARQLTAVRDRPGMPLHETLPTILAGRLPEPDKLAAPGPLPPNAFLPFSRNEDFTGREAILQQMASYFWTRPEENSPSIKIVALTGMGGVGKTQTAIEYTFRYGRYYPGGVFWMSFDEADDVPAQVAVVGSERGMGLYRETEQLTSADRTGRVQRAWQEPIPRLLIFDNCEDEALLEKWRPVSGGCHLLLTGRRARWARGLQIKNFPLSVLATQESVSLLQKFVPAISQEAAHNIAATVGGLPLALHLAGGFLRRYPSITPEAYLAQLQETTLLQHPSLQGRGAVYSPTGHELNVARTFAVSLEQLDPADETNDLARQLLACATCFAPGEYIPRDLLLATINGNEEDVLTLLLAEDALARLVALGFLKMEGREQVLMHRLLAIFVQEALPDTQQAMKAVERAVFLANERIFEYTGASHPMALGSVHMRHLLQSPHNQASVNQADLARQFGQHLHFMADFENSQLYLEKALAIYRQVYQNDHVDIARCLASLASLNGRAGNYDEAITLYEQALVIYEKIFGPEHIRIAMTLNNLGYFMSLQGLSEQALPILEKAKAIFQKKEADPEHPRIALALNNLGVAMLNLGRLEKAKSHLHRALQIRENHLGPEHPFTAVSLQNMGLLYLELGRLETAQEYLERSLTIRENSLGPIHPHIARSLNALSRLFILNEDLVSAESTLERAWQIQETALRPGHPETALTLKNFGDLYWVKGIYGKARSYYEKALSILKKTTAPENHDMVHIYNHIFAQERANRGGFYSSGRN